MSTSFSEVAIELASEQLDEARSAIEEVIAEQLGIEAAALDSVATDTLVELAMAAADLYDEGIIEGRSQALSLGDLMMVIGGGGGVSESIGKAVLDAPTPYGFAGQESGDFADADGAAIDGALEQIQTVAEKADLIEAALAKNGIYLSDE
jgi:hypothetical protein